MKAFELVSSYSPAGDQPVAIKQLVEGIGKHKEQVLLGVTGSGKTFTCAAVIAALQRPTLIMSPNKTLAAQLWAEFREFFPHNAVEYFVSYYDYYQPEAYIPRTDTYIEKDSSRNEEIDRMRNSATRALLTRRDVIVVASVSCIYGIGSPEYYLGQSLELKTGAMLRRDILLRKLADLQYARNDTDFGRSRFRARGDVIDIQPSYEEIGTRIELFGDQIERIRDFDPLTGEILRERDEIVVFPATHYVTPEEQRKRALVQIAAELEERKAELLSKERLLEAQRLEQRTHFDLEMIEQTGTCAGIENYSRHLAGRAAGERPFCLFDYLPEDTLVIIDESHVAVPQVHGMHDGDRSRKVPLVEYGFRLPSAMDNRPLRFDEWRSMLCDVLYVSATPGPFELAHATNVVEQINRPTGLVDPVVEVRPTAEQIDNLLEEVRRCTARNQRTLVTTLTKKMAEDLTDYLCEVGVRARYLHSDIDTLERIAILRELRLGSFDVLVGINLLREGIDLPEVALVAILDADKEGFLRGQRSLIQTIGRAARNVDGKVLLYADTVSEGMRAAMEETERRRNLQIAFNREHGITPTTIVKAVSEMEMVREEVELQGLAVAERDALSPADRDRLCRDLERQMRKAAAELDFERAAELRDRIGALRSGSDGGEGPVHLRAQAAGAAELAGAGDPRRREEGAPRTASVRSARKGRPVAH